MAVDTNLLVRRLLLDVPAVVSLLGSNLNGSVYCGDLAETFDPSLGPAIQISGGGGSSHPEMLNIADDRKQIRVWAGVDEYFKARTLYGAVQDYLHGLTNKSVTDVGFVMRCLETVSGQDVTDPETGWATVVSFFQIKVRPN